MKVYPKYLHITLVTANMLKGQPLNNPHEDLQWIANTWHPDLVGCQEAQDYHAPLSTVKGYGYALAPNTPYWGKEDPIIYNEATMRHVGSTSYFMSNGQKGIDPDRYLNASHFVTRVDGVDVWYFNTHVNHHIEVGGHERNSYAADQATLHFQRMAERVQARAKGTGSFTFWGGDLNVDETADDKYNWHGFPNYIFHRHNMISVWDELGLHPPSRTIDIIGSCNEDRDVKALNYSWSPTSVHSDHRFLRVDYSIPRGHTSAGANVAATPKPGTADPVNTPAPTINQWWDLNQDPAFPQSVPVPEAEVPLAPILKQPTDTWDHSVCCKK